MKSAFLFFLILLTSSMSPANAQGETRASSEKDAFATKFRENYQGEYTLNPSESCRPVRQSTRVKIDLVPDQSSQKIRVIYLDLAGKQVGSKLYSLDSGRIGAVNSKTAQPNSLLWETDVTDASSSPERGGTNFERMTFNEHALSFDILKTRDPQGFFRFFKPDETVAVTRCNFTRTEFMNAKPDEVRRIRRKGTLQ